MMQFKGFKPEAMKRIAGSLGYQGDMDKFDQYLQSNPSAMQKMDTYRKSAMKMASGGYVQNYRAGGAIPVNPTEVLNSAYNLMSEEEKAATTLPTSNMFQPINTSLPNTGMVVQDPNASLYQRPLQRPGSENLTGVVNPDDKMLSAGLVALGQNPIKTSASTTADTPPTTTPPEDKPEDKPKGKSAAEVTIERLQDPTGSMPEGTTVEATKIETSDDQIVDDTAGQVGEAKTGTTTEATTTDATAPEAKAAATVEAETTKDDVDAASKVDVAKGEVSDKAQVEAAQETESSVSDLEAAQGEAILMKNPVQREIQDGEIISGAANAQKAAKFTEEVQAATATPSEKATVQGQLGELTKDFDANNPPAWAAGALRGVMSKMASRGISASSMAGQAMVQAAMESALPIAQADASTFAKFEAQNLSNRQQRAMLAAQQRAQFMGQEFDQAFQARVMNASKISDVANMNFTAEQTVALENSRIANTMNMANLNNRQAMVMAEAAALSNLDMANLSNRQQAAVQNAQNFMSMDMANLSNQQAANMFAAQSRVQSMFTDAAARNAANAFNATSENQTNQFYDSLSAQVSQFNASQSNAMSQYNAGQKNAMSQFNANVQNQREQFNANNRLVVDQFNANWRRQVATVDNATVNRVNELNAKNALDVSNTAYNNLFSFYSDTMKWAFDSSENEKDRIANMTMEEMRQKGYKDRADDKNNSSWWSAAGNLVGNLLMADSDSVVGTWMGYNEGS